MKNKKLLIPYGRILFQLVLIAMIFLYPPAIKSWGFSTTQAYFCGVGIVIGFAIFSWILIWGTYEPRYIQVYMR